MMEDLPFKSGTMLHSFFTYFLSLPLSLRTLFLSLSLSLLPFSVSFSLSLSLSLSPPSLVSLAWGVVEGEEKRRVVLAPSDVLN